MLLTTHSPCGSDLTQPNLYSNIWLWGRNNLYTQSEKSVAEPKQCSAMEPSSPTSPTSTDAANSPTPSLSPISPSFPSYKSIWGSKKLSDCPPPQRSKWSNTPSSIDRKLTLQYILESPRSPSFTMKMLERNTDASSLVDVEKTGRECSVSSTNTDDLLMRSIDWEGDVIMGSPTLDAEFQSAWAATTTSPILRKVVGVPEHSAFESETQRQLPSLHSILSSPPTKSAHNNLESTTTSTSATTKTQSRSQSQSRASSRFRMDKRGRSKDRTGSNVSQHQSSSRSRPTTTTRKSLSSYPDKIVIPNENKQYLQRSIEHLGIRLIPLISVIDRQPHPDFPRSVLQYHLLTHHQLDSLACWYHQTFDNERERYMYPAIIEQPWTWENERMRSRMAVAREISGEPELDLATKRRRFGRFIGLRGCESPITETVEGDIEAGNIEEKKESLAEQMEKEWKAALRRAEEEQQLQEKMWRGRW